MVHAPLACALHDAKGYPCRTMIWRIVAILVYSMLPACGDNDRVCEPGRQVPCACPGGSSSAQVCKQAGDGYEPCQCDQPGTPVSEPRPDRDQERAAPTSEHRWSEKDLVACPSDAIALAARLTPPMDDNADEGVEQESARCTAGLFPQPGWAIVFRRGLSHHQVVVDAGTKQVIARAEPARVSGRTVIDVHRLATIDFDGDGDSEILHVYDAAAGGEVGKHIDVLLVSGDSLEFALRESRAANPPGYEITKEPNGTRGVTIGDVHLRWTQDGLR